MKEAGIGMQHEHTIFRARDIQFSYQKQSTRHTIFRAKTEHKEQINTTRVHACELAYGRSETERRQGTY
jgi:hypothetical protein